MAAKKTTPDFERSLAELEETVRCLEAGDLPLESSLAAFEKGIALVRTLHSRLDAVQMRIDELTQGAGGAPVARPSGIVADDDDDDEDDTE